MNDLIVKQFKNDIFYNFVWNNKPCWIAVEVADLFGYAQKSRPISNCIRREVMPALREKGYYVSNEEKMQVNYKKETSKDMLRKTTTNNTGDKLDKLKAAYDSAMMFKELLDDMTLDSTYKFLLIKQIYLDAGINLPKYIEEEKI